MLLCTYYIYSISLEFWCIFDNSTKLFSFISVIMFGHIHLMAMLMNTPAASVVQMTMLTLILTLEYLQLPMMDIMNSFSKLYQ